LHGEDRHGGAKTWPISAKKICGYRLPTIYATREFVEARGLLSYAPNYSDLYWRATSYVDKAFKGAKPGELPVEQPTKFELVINLRAAKALGVAVPPQLLSRADEVVD
jgi:putative tryptophan/tyrosine transport system substrate-binding protein